jgi:surface protein
MLLVRLLFLGMRLFVSLVALAAAATAAVIEHDVARNVLVSSVVLEAPNLPANTTQRLASAAKLIDALHCAVCSRHGECVWQGDHYERCTCNAGWSGETCATALPCDCQNNGTCLVDATRGGVCMCREGYSGLRCEESVALCGLGACPNGTVCVQESTCVAVVAGCALQPCLNGGECLPGGRCACPPGFSGTQCQSDANECESSPCRNGGTCANTVNGFTCVCPSDYTGSHCQAAFSACSSSPCRFGSVCNVGPSATRMFICSTFITRWDTNRTSIGSSNSSQIRLPLETGGTYNFVVQWGDGTSASITSSLQAVRTYAAAGVYNVSITGTLVGWRFNNGGDRQKLLDVMQWGTMRLGNNGSYFYGASNMVMSAMDTPDLTGTTNMQNMFRDSTLFNQPIGGWDVSRVMNMQRMFSSASSFNQPIGAWNVSSVNNMQWMFENARSFNQPVGEWDLSRVTDMESMFFQASSFNQPIGKWNVTSVTNMQHLFVSASSFNQPIGGWDVSRVNNMGFMFYQASSFNQPIGGWNVSRVNNMEWMFYGATLFDQPIGGWDVSSVTSMWNMFDAAVSFNQDIRRWCVRQITTKPFGFDLNTSSSWTDARKPVWGTCPPR